MILIENNNSSKYSSKFWLTEDIQDCGNCNEIKLTINTEKLKVKHNNNNNIKNVNGNTCPKNKNSNNPNRINHNIKNNNKHQSNRYENKSCLCWDP